jgi:type I restriction enzyme M protein
VPTNRRENPIRPLAREQSDTVMTEQSGLLTAPEDRIVDYIDGVLRRKSPEEYVRQNMERSLVQEYRYTRDQISVEFRIKVGASRKKVDLAVFLEGKPHTQQNIAMIVECKREETPPDDQGEGVGQLKSYMAASVNCRFGVWTNGSNERICLVRDEADGLIEFPPVIDIPLNGEGWKEPEAPNRSKLRPATSDNLLLAFKRCHNYVAVNQGLQKPEAFWELLRVIFCKIEDERSLEPAVQFYVTTKEIKSPDGQLRCLKRVGTIFETVKSKFPSIFKKTDEIGLERHVLAYIVSQLQSYSLIESSVDVKGIAYEEIVGSNLRGDRGEFFTPRNACKMAVRLLDPPAGKSIIDPACGTGGFLITAMNHVLGKIDQKIQKRWRDPEDPTDAERHALFEARVDFMKRYVTGLDLNPNLVRAAKMNMVMNNDGSGGLSQADSLRDPVLWSDEVRERVLLGTFDFVFTNPPFGANLIIDSPEVLRQYDLAAIWDVRDGRWVKRLDQDGHPVLQSSQPPEILFIERCVQLLKPGIGRMAMVIPNGILNNTPLGYIRQWLLDQTQILAIVDMQRDLFQPRNDTQTSMVFLRRLTEAERKRPTDYPMFMAVTDKIGHDKRGNPIYKRDLDGQDLLIARSVRALVSENGQLVDRIIEERTPVVDDQLIDVPELYRAWSLEHGL